MGRGWRTRDEAGEALLTADQRMYSNKATRSSASRQLTDVLLQVLTEQDKDIDAHVGQVEELAALVARALGLPDPEVRRVGLAAPALAHTAPLVRSGHERMDGTGYPDGLRGEQIPIGSRIIAVCDAYDAMTSSRADREAMPQDAALAELTRGAASQFDPEIVQAFCRVVPPALAAGPVGR
jgi:two-component system cell cycle response regulator